jgi:hypothetical protein
MFIPPPKPEDTVTPVTGTRWIFGESCRGFTGETPKH